ncbi:hypothetical protein COOONC_15832 [Cooperia oncophora]
MVQPSTDHIDALDGQFEGNSEWELCGIKAISEIQFDEFAVNTTSIMTLVQAKYLDSVDGIMKFEPLEIKSLRIAALSGCSKNALVSSQKFPVRYKGRKGPNRTG